MSFSLSVEHRVARITLSAPPLNILTASLQQDLAEQVRALNQRQDFNVLVIRSALTVFSAGADVREHAGRDNVSKMLKAAHGLIAALLDCPVPTLAAINGTCLGGAFELALACDTVVARDDAQLGLPEISLACFPPAALVLGSWKLPPMLLAELLTRGQPLSAATLASRGAGFATAAGAEYERALDAASARYAGLSHDALTLTTRLLRPGASARFTAQVSAAENAYLEQLLTSPDATEGVAAFLEKRAPRYGT